MKIKQKKPPLAYLSGAIEGAPDNGRDWRRRVRRFLESELHHRIFDPTENSVALLTPEEFLNFRRWKITEPQKFSPIIHRIIDHDLSILTKETSYVVCYWDEYVCRGAGTAAEISIAYLLKIPVYFIPAISLEDISSWAVGCSSEVFTSFRHFYAFMRRKYHSSTKIKFEI